MVLHLSGLAAKASPALATGFLCCPAVCWPEAGKAGPLPVTLALRLAAPHRANAISADLMRLNRGASRAGPPHDATSADHPDLDAAAVPAPSRRPRTQAGRRAVIDRASRSWPPPVVAQHVCSGPVFLCSGVLKVNVRICRCSRGPSAAAYRVAPLGTPGSELTRQPAVAIQPEGSALAPMSAAGTGYQDPAGVAPCTDVGAK
jgi:hypothetical protein